MYSSLDGHANVSSMSILTAAAAQKYHAIEWNMRAQTVAVGSMTLPAVAPLSEKVSCWSSSVLFCWAFCPNKESRKPKCESWKADEDIITHLTSHNLLSGIAWKPTVSAQGLGAVNYACNQKNLFISVYPGKIAKIVQTRLVTFQRLFSNEDLFMNWQSVIW